MRLASLLPLGKPSLEESWRADERSITNFSNSIICFFCDSFSTSSETMRLDICSCCLAESSFSFYSLMAYSSSYLFCSFIYFNYSVRDGFWWGCTEEFLLGAEGGAWVFGFITISLNTLGLSWVPLKLSFLPVEILPLDWLEFCCLIDGWGYELFDYWL